MIVGFVKKNINNLLKKGIYQYIQDTIQLFQIWHNLCSELTSILAIQKQPTNRPQLNKSDRPQVNIWDTCKTLNYLNINDSFHLKDLEISKYKRESKARMPIKFCCLIFINCGLFSFLNIKNENTVADENVLLKNLKRQLALETKVSRTREL